MPLKLASSLLLLLLLGALSFPVPVYFPTAAVAQDATPSAASASDISGHLEDLSEIARLDIVLANAEFMNYAWPAPEFSSAVLNPKDTSATVREYLNGVSYARKYADDCGPEINRLTMHSEFWGARVARENAALSAVENLINKLDKNDPRYGGIVTFRDLLQERRSAFVTLQDRYKLAISQVQHARYSAMTVANALVNLAEIQTAIPPGLSAFQLSDMIKQGMSPLATTRLQELSAIADRHIASLRQFEEAMRQAMQDESDRLAPLNDIQKFLTIFQLVLQAYQVQEVWRRELAPVAAAPAPTSDTVADAPAAPTESTRIGATGEWKTRQDVVDELTASMQKLGDPPSEAELLTMSEADRTSYYNLVSRTVETLRFLEPSAADDFAERYIFEDIDLSDNWTRGQGVMDFLSIVLRPQVVQDGTPGGLAHRDDMWRQLAPHQRLIDFIKGGPDMRDLILMPTYPAMIERPTGPSVKAEN